MNLLLYSRLPGRVFSFAVAASFIGLWQVTANSGVISPLYLPSPDAAWAALMRGLQSGTLLRQTLGTLEHMFYGWLVASAVAILVGSLIGTYSSVRIAVTPLLEFLRPLPTSAAIPLAIAFMGLTNGMAIFVITFGTVWPVLLSTVHGFVSVEPRLYEVARLLNMGRAETIRKIILPSALPDILAGMRISVTAALILSVVCEIIAGLNGLGHYIMVSARLYRSPDLYAGVILLGIIGYLSSLLVTMAENRLLRWRQRGH